MNEKSILNKVRTLLGLEVKLETMMLSDGVSTLEADAFELAIKSFKINKLNHQYSASAFDGLGDAYRESGQFNLAKKNYQQAIKLAKSNQSKHVSYYQEQLASVITLADQ